MLSVSNYRCVSVSQGRRVYLVPPMIMGFEPTATFADVLATVSNVSHVAFPFGNDEASIAVFTADDDIPASSNGQLVINGMSLNALDFMHQFKEIHVKYDFPEPHAARIPVSNAFTTVMSNATSNSYLPPAKPRSNRADDLYNDVRESLDKKGLGWSSSQINSTGKRFLDLLSSTMFYLDQFRSYFVGRGLRLPHILGLKDVYNDPKSHGHAAASPLAVKTQDILRKHADVLLSIMESPWFLQP